MVGNNYPTDYSTAVWGPANSAGMFDLGTSGLVNEVLALAVNESSGFTENPLALTQPVVAAILNHNITNWSQVVDVKGNPVASGPLPITIVNREHGSGSRAATDILIVGDNCGSNAEAVSLFNKHNATEYYSTPDVLTAANSIAGAITYASIDNFPSATTPNLVPVSLNGVVPSNLAAASGTYPFWVEAHFVNNAANTGADVNAINNIVAVLQNQSTMASLPSINAIPYIRASNGSPINLNTTVHANPALGGIVPSGGGPGATVYINPFTRNGNTCSLASYGATVIP